MNLIHSIMLMQQSWTINKINYVYMQIYVAIHVSCLQGPGGQLGQMELQLLWVEGLRAPLAMPPETLHLPPIEEQRCSHTALPSRTSWPVTNTMLRSFV